MRGAVAAGHPLTAAAGARVLEEGGNAVDACVAAAFAAWVTESPLTGPGAGGFALVAPADGRPARVADFFVSTPGLGSPAATEAEMDAVDVGFGGDSDTTQVFRIGEASCAVPGAAAGLEAVHRAYGRLPWRVLLEPAIELARSGVEISRPQAHLHAILDLILRHTVEGRRVYSSPDGSRLGPADTLRLPDLVEHARAARRGRGGSALSRRARAVDRPHDRHGRWRDHRARPGRLPRCLAAARAGRLPRARGDLESAAFFGRDSDRVRPWAAGRRRGPCGGQRRVDSVAGRGDARADAGSRGALHERPAPRRARAPAALRRGDRPWPSPDCGRSARARRACARDGTTHVSVVDAEGTAASLSSSTGSGSGVIVPGTGIHLNNMLGEYDLVAGGPAEPGRRLTSMMAPTVVIGAGGPRLVIGSAGSVRLRGAIMQVIVNVARAWARRRGGDRSPARARRRAARALRGRFRPGGARSRRVVRLRRRALAEAQPLLRRNQRRRAARTARWLRPAMPAGAAAGIVTGG